jgi:hypothetical protein
MRQATKLFVQDKSTATRLDEVANSLLATPAGVLMLSGQDAMLWTIKGPNAKARLIRAAVRHWDALESLGPRVRYIEQLTLWQATTNLTRALAQAGVPIPVLRSPLGPRGLRGVVEDYIPAVLKEPE